MVYTTIASLPADEPIDVQAEDKQYKFVLVYHWLLFSPLTPQAKVLYQVLVAHVNQERGDTKVWPTKKTLAASLGLKKEDSVDKYLDELYAYKLVSVRKQKQQRGKMQDRNIYTVKINIPRDWQGPESLGQWYEALNLESPRKQVPPSTGVLQNGTNSKSPGREVPPSTGVRTPVHGGPVPPWTGVELNEKKLNEEKYKRERRAKAATSETEPASDGLHTLPEDFCLTDSMRRWTIRTFGNALDPDVETAKFIAYWRSEGRRKRNWYAAWEKWMHDAKAYATKQATSRLQSHQDEVDAHFERSLQRARALDALDASEGISPLQRLLEA